jgi:hypothetical protein
MSHVLVITLARFEKSPAARFDATSSMAGHGAGEMGFKDEFDPHM